MVRLARSAFSGFTGTGNNDALPVPLEHGARLGVSQVSAEPLAEARVTEPVYQLLAVMGLDRVERRMAVEGVGARQSEIERQRLTGDLDIELIAARLGRGA